MSLFVHRASRMRCLRRFCALLAVVSCVGGPVASSVALAQSSGSGTSTRTPSQSSGGQRDGAGQQQPAAPESNAASKELADAWGVIAATTSEAVLEAFITRAAGTIYADLARARLAEVRTQAQAAEAQRQAEAEAQSDPSTSGEVTCDALWHQRNSLFHQFSYCFGTDRGRATFGNAGCSRTQDQAWQAMGESNRQVIHRIRDLERQYNCPK